MRIQFYPSEELEVALEKEANEKNVTVPILVNDLLLMHYGLIPATTLSNSELRKVVIDEIADFVLRQPVGEEFDLNVASPTYNRVEMCYAGKPNTIKAQIGKEFNNHYVGKIEPFKNLKQVKLSNGKPKKSVGNRAALYIVLKK